MCGMAIDDIKNKELLRKLGNRMNGTWTMKEVLDAIRALEEKHLKDKIEKVDRFRKEGLI
jgi:hypothetical protein